MRMEYLGSITQCAHDGQWVVRGVPDVWRQAAEEIDSGGMPCPAEVVGKAGQDAVRLRCHRVCSRYWSNAIDEQPVVHWIGRRRN